MSRVSVDAGAYRMVVNLLTRASQRHGEPTLLEACNALQETAEVIDDPLITCDACGNVTENPWHSSKGENRHYHTCDACHTAQLEDLTGGRLTVGDGLEVYGTRAALLRAQAYILIGSKHPVEEKDTARYFANALNVAENKIRLLEAKNNAT